MSPENATNSVQDDGIIMRLPGEAEAIATVKELGARFGYGNLIHHLRNAWSQNLQHEYGLDREAADRGSGHICSWCDVDSRTGKTTSGYECVADLFEWATGLKLWVFVQSDPARQPWVVLDVDGEKMPGGHGMTAAEAIAGAKAHFEASCPIAEPPASPGRVYRHCCPETHPPEFLVQLFVGRLRGVGDRWYSFVRGLTNWTARLAIRLGCNAHHLKSNSLRIC